MATPDPIQNEPSKLKRIMNSPQDDSIMSRLPRGNGTEPPTTATPAIKRPVRSLPVRTPAPQPVATPVEDKSPRWRWKFLPAFWTIASVMSFTVNIVMLIVILLLFMNRGSVSNVATDQANQLLGGLYSNFVKMDQASITTNIPVDANIPLNIVVPVQATTRITLAESATIPNAHVRINTGAMIIDANAIVTLPANTPLTVNLDFPLTVQNTIPIHLDVPVNIPLSQTQLHEPFVGLQKVVEPWYCLSQPNALVNNVRVCDNVVNPLAPVLELMTP